MKYFICKECFTEGEIHCELSMPDGCSIPFACVIGDLKPKAKWKEIFNPEINKLKKEADEAINAHIDAIKRLKGEN